MNYRKMRQFVVSPRKSRTKKLRCTSYKESTHSFLCGEIKSIISLETWYILLIWIFRISSVWWMVSCLLRNFLGGCERVNYIWRDFLLMNFSRSNRWHYCYLIVIREKPLFLLDIVTNHHSKVLIITIVQLVVHG